MKKKTKQKKRFDYGKFFKKYRIRFMEKSLDMAILLGVGWALGLHLVRGI